MPSELSGLALREAVARALGWKSRESALGTLWLRPDGVEDIVFGPNDETVTLDDWGMPGSPNAPMDWDTNIAAAFEVIEKMREKGFWLVEISQSKNWTCVFERLEDSLCDSAEGDTAPEAICRAALAALEAAK